MIYGPDHLHALCGPGLLSGPILRAALRHNAAEKAVELTPSRLQGSMSQEETVAPRAQDFDPFYLADKARLKALDGRPCPLCSCPLEFDVTSLVCPRGHGWSNPKVAESEIR